MRLIFPNWPNGGGWHSSTATFPQWLGVDFNSSKNISVLLGNGDGTFGTKTDYDVGLSAYGVVITDLNGDDKPDLIWQNTNGLVAAWFMDNTNHIGSTLLRNGQRMADGWQLKALADLNNDLKKDFVWQHTNGLLATWFMNDRACSNTLAAWCSSYVPRLCETWFLQPSLK